jgi:hydroxyethylthiazole kinase-like uncharacterized protein yjeF
MIVGVGTDLVDLGRFRTVLERRPELVDRLFTATEIAYARLRTDPTERFAVRFATKEAVLKSMGVGLGAADWHDIEVERDPDGRPTVVVRGRAASLAARLGIVDWRVTLSHSDLVATALVVALGAAPVSGHRPPAPATPVLSVGSSLDAGALVPIVTPEEMAAIDRDAPEPVDVLIGRAGAAVARAAVRMLGGTYGRRVVVLAGKGNNGNDGREAARRLRRRGVRVTLLDVATFDPAAPPTLLPDCDLVIDAAYGTGLRGSWAAPRRPAGAMVLAVDIPSGVDGLTGACAGDVLAADTTVTFAALKPGLVQGEGRRLSGDIEVADIGLDTGFETGRARAALVGAAAVASWLPTAPVDTHKWRSAVWVVAGAPGMGGAASLCTGAALRSGAGYVRVSTPGGPAAELPTESVRVDLPVDDWSAEVVSGLDRFAALVIGNGLGTAPETATEIRRVVAAAAGRGLPTVVDADALGALGTEVARFVGPTTVLTPHDGEYTRLVGEAPGPDRLAAARSLATASGAVVLLKGPTTVVAAPDGRALVSIAGDRRLATAGTGDVLAGVIGALCARGLDPWRAAAAGAFIHGRAGALGWPLGLVAGDVVSLVPAVLDDLTRLQP